MEDPPPPSGSTTTRPASEPPIVFPSIARLELDAVLAQLVERAQDVLATQSRLRALLRATRAVAGDLSLPVLLRRVVEAACELVGARYGALAVRGPAGPAQLVHVGPDDALVGALGHLAADQGLLSLLEQDARPLRLDDVTRYAAASGRPPGEPPLQALLGVPVQVRGEVLGSLCVADDDTRASFTGEDEELLAALAGAAAVAIDNARLFDAVRRQARWTQTGADVCRAIAAGTPDPLALLVAELRQVAEADLAAVLVADRDRPEHLRVLAADGEQATSLRLSSGPGLAGLALESDEPVRVDGSRHALLGTDPAAGPAVLLRLRLPDGEPVLVALVRRTDGAPFAPDVTDLAPLLARQVEVALHLHDARQRAAATALRAERERLEHVLQRSVVSRLLGLGLDLAGTAALAEDPAVRTRLDGHLETVDAALRSLRSTVLAQREVPAGPRP